MSIHDANHSRGQQGDESAKLFAVASFSQSRPGAPLVRRVCFCVEDADSPWTFSDLVEPSPNHADLWRSVVTVRHARVGFLEPPDTLPETLSLRSVCRALPASQRTSLHPARESGAGESPRAPFVVSWTLEPKPEARSPRIPVKGGRGARVPFRLLSTRAPRQAVLRASSRLAPWIRHEVSRPPGFQDARCVRSTSAIRTTCVHPHLARSRLALAAFAAWTLRGVLGSAQLDRGSDVSRRPYRFGGSSSNTDLTFGATRVVFFPEVVNTGVLFPWCTMRPSLWHSCRFSFFHLVSRAFARANRPLCFHCVTGPRREGAAKAAIPVASWKATLQHDPECLPPSGTLRRIRWPLQPRSRDDLTACAMNPPLDGVLTPPWAFADRDRFRFTIDSSNDSSKRRLPRDSRPGVGAALGPRSLEPLPLFGGALPAYLRPGVRLPTSATAFTTCGQPNRSSRSSQGRRPWPSSFSVRVTLAFLAEAVTRGEPRYVRSIRPRCRFLPLARVCPTAIPDRPRHPRRLLAAGV